MPNQKTARLSPGNPPYELSTDDLNRAGGFGGFWWINAAMPIWRWDYNLVDPRRVQYLGHPLGGLFLSAPPMLEKLQNVMAVTGGPCRFWHC
jgi:hypothetical protein